MTFLKESKPGLKQTIIDFLAISGISQKIVCETSAVIQCPKCSYASASINLYNGWMYCPTCKCVMGYKEIAKRLGFIIKDNNKNIKDAGIMAEHLGVFGRFNGPTQSETEKFVSDCYKNLMGNERFLKNICDQTSLHRESIKAYKMGLITAGSENPFFICLKDSVVIPVISLYGNYSPPRFYCYDDLKNKLFLNPKGIGKASIFWGKINKRRDPLFFVDTPIDAMLLSQELFFSHLPGNVISSSSPGVIPKEAIFTKYFGYKDIRVITVNGKLFNKAENKLPYSLKKKVSIYWLQNISSFSSGILWKKKAILDLLFMKRTNNQMNNFDFKEL